MSTDNTILDAWCHLLKHLVPGIDEVSFTRDSKTLKVPRWRFCGFKFGTKIEKRNLVRIVAYAGNTEVHHGKVYDSKDFPEKIFDSIALCYAVADVIKSNMQKIKEKQTMRVFARKKPVVIEAIQFTGLLNSTHEVIDFCGKDAFFAPDGQLKIHTLEGDMNVSINDYVIRGVNGEFYPCRADIFEKTYERVNPDDEHSNAVTNQAQAVDPAEKPQNFSWALQWLKDGHKVARLNWNGKGQFVTMQNGSTVLGSQMRNENAKNFYGDREVKIRPHLDIKTADDSYVCGWVPSTGDLFAEDWVIVKD